jgi:hypothetical protein
MKSGGMRLRVPIGLLLVLAAVAGLTGIVSVGRLLVRHIDEHKYVEVCTGRGPVAGVAFSQDGRKVIYGTGQGTIYAWELHAREEWALASSSTRIADLRSEPKGSTILVGYESGAIESWDGQRLTVQRGFPFSR